MTKSIIITGRGGTGKTTFTALASRFLPRPRLLIDADPDQCLAVMLGVDLAAEGVRTVSEALFEIQSGRLPAEVKSLPLADRVEYLLHLSCLYESDDFDLLTLGVKWTRGCYCAPNDALRAIIPTLAGSYRSVVLDSPAGIEHVNRRVLGAADDVFAVLDPSAKAIRNARTVRDLAGEIGMDFRNLYLVANHRFPPERVAALADIDGADLLGQVAPDSAVERADWEGRSLLDLPADSPACTSVAAILRHAGYGLEGAA